ncbi:MAG TPA: radical SAM protein [Gammaproteobacteria bacterium]|nr:radical SAM protein [Gammaproteobacteria bacterium]
MRFIIRNEFFGGLAYDRIERDYFHLDHLAMRILTEPKKDITASEKISFETDDKEISDITNQLNHMGLIDNSHFLGNQSREGMLSAPTRIFLEITYECPEKCAHCYTESGKRRANEMSLVEKFSIIDQMAAMGCFRLSIAGGEPLVDRDFFPVVERAIANHIDVSFSTSGTPITEKAAKKLAGLDIRTINISLDGYDQTSYEQVRGSGRYQYMLRGVQNLRKHYSGKIAAKCTLMTSNIKHLDQIIKLAEDLKFDVVKFNCVREAGRAGEHTSLIPTQDEYIESMKILADFYNNKKSKIKLVLPVNPYQKFGDDSASVIDDLGFGCYAGKESFCITAEGQIQPCTSFGPLHYVDGNLRDRSLLDAWISGPAMKLFRGLEGSSACQSCPSYQGCRGGCYLRSFSAYGNINATDPYCYERKNDPLPQSSTKYRVFPVKIVG